VSAVAASLALTACCAAQVPFGKAIELAVQHSPRVRSAENDLARSKAALAITKDIYVPSVVVGGGVGDSYGITLTVPTVFTVSAQSLVFSFQQRSYIKAARFDLQAAEMALNEVREQVEQDAALTYVSLVSGMRTVATLKEQNQIATRLADIMQVRLKANLESEVEVMKYQRGAIQIKLALLQAEDKIEDLRAHLSQITGIPADEMAVVTESVPDFAALSEEGLQIPADRDTPGIRAAQANSKARELRAHGDAQYAWRPQIGFGATYGRVSPINNVSEFYTLHGNYNSMSAGVTVQFPILDRIRRQAAVESKLDADRAFEDLESSRSDELAGRRKLQRSIPELSAKVELAALDYQIARNDVETAELRAAHATDTNPITPKEVEDAHIAERQKFADLLDARLQTAIAEVSCLGLNGQLDAWLASHGLGSTAIPAQMGPGK
jgi:outer membrane protein TolC